MSQSSVNINPAVGKLERLPQSVVAYGREKVTRISAFGMFIPTTRHYKG